MTQTVPTTQAPRSAVAWCVLRPFVVRRGSSAPDAAHGTTPGAALGVAPDVVWLPLEGHAYDTRDEAVRAATALFAEPPTEHALAELRRVVRVGEREQGTLTFEAALDAREAAREREVEAALDAREAARERRAA